MKPAHFEYHAPSGAQEIVSLLAELGDGAKVLAGGQSLVPMLALRLAVFEHLVDLGQGGGAAAALSGANGSVWVGAATTQASIERSAEVDSAVPLLARATPLIGHFQIRNRGTVGGSIAHADPPPSTRPWRWPSTRRWRCCRLAAAESFPQPSSSLACGAPPWRRTRC